MHTFPLKVQWWWDGFGAIYIHRQMSIRQATKRWAVSRNDDEVSIILLSVTFSHNLVNWTVGKNDMHENEARILCTLEKSLKKHTL